MNKLIEILGFLGAMRDYSYIDRLSGALDETGIYEALNDAIRAYLSLCQLGRKCWVEHKDKLYECPETSRDELEKNVETVLREIEGKSGAEIVRYSRQLAMRAYATIPKIRVIEKQEAGEGVEVCWSGK